MAKQKIADLPQEEQEKIISEMKELGIGGVYATYTVEKALAAIAKKKEGLSGSGNPGADEQTPGETTTEESSDAAGVNGETDEDGELPEGLSEDAKNFLNGETDELPEDAEEINADEIAETLKETESAESENDEEPEEEPEEDETQEETPEESKEPVKAKFNGVCHICRSKVYDGVCSGCGFKLRV